MFCPSQDWKVRPRWTSREQLMSLDCPKYQVLSFAKMLVVSWTSKTYFVLISVLQSAQWINSERIYAQTRVSSFPGVISVAWDNKQRTTDVFRVLKVPGADTCLNACGVVNEGILFWSVSSGVLYEWIQSVYIHRHAFHHSQYSNVWSRLIWYRIY